MRGRRGVVAWVPPALVSALVAGATLVHCTSDLQLAPVDAGSPDAADAADAAQRDGAAEADGSGTTPDVGTDAQIVRVFDLGTELSATVNPTGAWRLGYSTDATLDTFALEAVHTDVGNIHFWHPGADFAGYYPYVAGNATSATTTDASNSWAVRYDQLALEGSNTGQYAIVQFVAPDTAVYRVQADFEGLHFNLSTTDVHVRHGSVALFDALIDGYGGDPAFHAIAGASPRQSYGGTVALAAGDTVAFAIGYGANKTYNNDTTGLKVLIQELK